MAQVKFQNGSVVEDTYTNETEECNISEVYTWARILKNHQGNLRYYIRDQLREQKDDESLTLPEDSDVVKMHEYLKDLSINGASLGAVQGKATKFTGDDYFSNHDLGDAIDVGVGNETEVNFAKQLQGELSNRDKRVLKPLQLGATPLTPDKEEMPLYVASNERTEGLHTFEEAKEMWESFLSHINYDATTEPEETTNDESNDEPESDDEPEAERKSVNDPTTIDRIGSATIERIEAGGFDVVPSSNRHDHVEAEPFDFETSEAPQESLELTSSDVKERFYEVKEEMAEQDEMDVEIVKQRLIDGDLHDAVDTIEQYE